MLAPQLEAGIPQQSALLIRAWENHGKRLSSAWNENERLRKTMQRATLGFMPPGAASAVSCQSLLLLKLKTTPPRWLWAMGCICKYAWGEWLDSDKDYRDFRSATRYMLRSGCGLKLGEAEGKLSYWSNENHSPTGSLRIRFAPETQYVQIEEAFSGVGDRFRQIVFQPEAGTPSDKDGVPTRWQTLHLELPLRQAPWDNDNPGRIHGASNGKIYVEVDGQFYVFPVEKFAVTDLHFQAG